MKGVEAHHGIRDFLDEIVILLDPIVQRSGLPMTLKGKR